MTRAAWRRVRELFDQVVDRPPEERSALLVQFAADDADVRDEVQSLLNALAEDDSPFERNRAALARAVLEEHESGMEGRRVGAYVLIRRIGDGGMGDVYLAERVDGEFTRQVAIKLIKAGMDSEGVIRRFRQERQILAKLSHPAIAALLDGGITPEGRPYFVMEHVEGEAITRYCDKRNISVEDRIRLFREVCSVVHFAHQNLVIHRDLKPGNILVTTGGAVKLLDFGVAKLLRPDGEETTTLTMLGGRVFTPSYASPEQVRGDSVTTATDVYSLGVILYELLTGRLPFEMQNGSIVRVLEALSTTEPARPSDAVAEEPTRPLPSRAEPRALQKKLSGDLDNIALMAIRKEPERRYASAHELSEDLGRFLELRPVLARTDTVRYRVGKFVRRHRAGIAAAAGIAIALAIGGAGILIESQRAAAEKARAVQRLQDVRELASSLLFEVHDAVANLPGATEARRLILERGFQNLEDFSAQAGEDADVQWELAEAYLRLGLVQGQPTGASLGDLEGGRRSYSRAIDIATRLTQARPEDLRARRTLALAHEKLGDVDAWTGSVEAGVHHARTAVDLYRSIAEALPDSARHLLTLAIGLIKLGDLTGHPSFPNLERPEESIGHYQASLAILRARPLSDSATWTTRRYDALVEERIGMLHRIAGRHTAARTAFGRSLEERLRLAAERPANLDARRDVGVTRQNLCEVEGALGRRGTALALCRDALALYEDLFATDPRNAQAASDVAVGALSMAGANLAIGDSAAALRTFDRAISVLRSRLAAAPNHVMNRLNLARSLGRQSLLLRQLGRTAPLADEARSLLEALTREAATDERDAQLLATLSSRSPRR